MRWHLVCRITNSAYIFEFPIREKPLEKTNGHRLIHLCTATVDFTRMGANPPANTGEGDGVADEIDGFLKTSLRSEGHVPLNVNAAGTGVGARRLAHFVDNGTTWLAIFDVNDRVICARGGNGTNFDTIATGGAFF
ncbi:MAG: hypothetical protein MAG431_00868 [Chloroflexi bacterium]|nr:hypothetical protein [Chloroflexota bacterium]